MCLGVGVACVAGTGEEAGAAERGEDFLLLMVLEVLCFLKFLCFVGVYVEPL